MAFPDPSATCLICGEAAQRSLGEKNECGLFECRGCGSIHMGSSAKVFDYALYYPDAIHTASATVQRTLRQVLDCFEPFRKTGRLLDVGYGAADLAKEALRRGWKVYGTEFSQRACEYGRELGIEVFRGELAQAGYPAGHFDVVCASELVEHVQDPAQLIRQIAHVLRQGGVLWATTPHGQGLSRKVLGLRWSIIAPPEHRQLFSRVGAKKLLQSCGFDVLQLKTHSLNPYEIVAHFWPKRDKPHLDRVKSSQALNEALGASPLRARIKASANWGLNVLALGDSLRVLAIRR